MDTCPIKLPTHQGGRRRAPAPRVPHAGVPGLLDTPIPPPKAAPWKVVADWWIADPDIGRTIVLSPQTIKNKEMFDIPKTAPYLRACLTQFYRLKITMTGDLPSHNTLAEPMWQLDRCHIPLPSPTKQIWMEELKIPQVRGPKWGADGPGTGRFRTDEEWNQLFSRHDAHPPSGSPPSSGRGWRIDHKDLEIVLEVHTSTSIKHLGTRPPLPRGGPRDW